MRNRVLAFVMDSLEKRGEPYELKGPPEDCLLAADLFNSWSLLANDPGALTSPWFWTGAPAGILHQPDIGPLFPLVVEPDPEDHTLLGTHYDSFKNYSGVEDNDEAYQQLKGFSEKSPPWLQRMRTLKPVSYTHLTLPTILLV